MTLQLANKGAPGQLAPSLRVSHRRHECAFRGRGFDLRRQCYVAGQGVNR